MAEKESLRIGIDTLFESPLSGTGGLIYVRNIVKALGEVANGERLFLFASSTNAHLFRDLAPKSRLIKSGWSNERVLLRILSQQIVIPLLARRLKLDVLLCPGNVISFAAGVPKILILQNRLQYNLPRELGLIRSFYRKRIGKLSLRHAAKIVALSNELQQYLQENLRVPATRMVVVPGGVDHASFFPRQGEKRRRSGADEPYLLVVAALWPYKNHEILLRALALNHRRHGFNVKLLIVGGDWEGRVQQLGHLAGELGISERVNFIGHIPHEEMPQLYAEATVLLYPSLAECFPLPIFEAMASGVPVIASNCCSLPEVVGDAGICLEPHDEEAWADAIYRVMSDKELRSCMIERGLNRARQYTWKAAGEKLLKVLQEAVQENGSG